MLHTIEREDNYKHKKLRADLIQVLRKKGITDEKVLKAMEVIPRHFFLESALERIAYEDRAFPIVAGQTISQPYTVAFQSQLLDIQKWDRVLEIGTGSAYQSCVLAAMGAKVFTIERQKELYEYINGFFFIKKYPTIKRFFGDGFEGKPDYAPFNKVIITAAAPHIPPKLVEQMKVGGYMVIPLGDDGGQKMKRLTKQEDGTMTEEVFGDFSFVPMLSGKNQG
jgi:protein-L-isoaspartate(D-aspartate) O-methyltransferase